MSYTGQMTPTLRQASLQLVIKQIQRLHLQQQLIMIQHRTVMQGSCMAFSMRISSTEGRVVVLACDMLLQDFGKVPERLLTATSRYSSCNSTTHLICKLTCQRCVLSCGCRCSAGMPVNVMSVLSQCCKFHGLSVEVNGMRVHGIQLCRHSIMIVRLESWCAEQTRQ